MAKISFGKLDTLTKEITTFIKDRQQEIFKRELEEQIGKRRTLKAIEEGVGIEYEDNEDWVQTLLRDAAKGIKAVELSEQFPDRIDIDNLVDVQVTKVDNEEASLFITSDDNEVATRLGVHYFGGEIKNENGVLVAYNANKNIEFDSEVEDKIKEDLGKIISEEIRKDLENELRNKKIIYGK